MRAASAAVALLLAFGGVAVAQFGPGVLGVPSVPIGPGVSIPIGPSVGQGAGGGPASCVQGQLDFSTNCNTVFYVVGIT